ncbi:hypothetical protein TVNIR_2096 [Thioalkalivibrio nitratireducens DSM 14787]|uniref:Uncharacterized protein n=1 Tax=Thioalkalivibrio nitratireducens (strain DSM 14787 / UNIQEM 213 / ALEN2) TaxID=1255043 RepID=L0DZD9_THIND|nr:hypothetical protein [Thioalkalivibrio nitratireducens]AGA33756.1 hypothetical protein TVNIR_2096 [Thioalkalivibrio nitratireducens DSM 14787]
MARIHGPRHLEGLLRTVRDHQRQQDTLMKAHAAQRRALGEMLQRPDVNPLDVMRAETALNHTAPVLTVLRR